LKPSRRREKDGQERQKDILLEELEINPLLVVRIEAALVLEVAVAEVVAPAGLEEAPAVGLVGRVGAAVRGPDEVVGVLVVAVADEVAQVAHEHIVVRVRGLESVALAGLESCSLDRGGRDDAAGEGEGSREEGGELHCVLG